MDETTKRLYIAAKTVFFAHFDQHKPADGDPDYESHPWGALDKAMHEFELAHPAIRFSVPE